tara:strand:+ start:184 stop:381 length:198 start_codon:yes stop_codon:yes gene_type:complete
MTRKDYIKLASIIKDSSTLMNVRGQPRHVLDRGEFMYGLCGMLEDDNPNFDERKFREATGEILGE